MVQIKNYNAGLIRLKSLQTGTAKEQWYSRAVLSGYSDAVSGFIVYANDRRSISILSFHHRLRFLQYFQRKTVILRHISYISHPYPSAHFNSPCHNAVNNLSVLATVYQLFNSHFYRVGYTSLSGLIRTMKLLIMIFSTIFF